MDAEQIRDELRKELARREYSSYVEYVHSGKWLRGKAVTFLCDKVQNFIERKTEASFEILMISLPPQHGKSMTITETLPSWYLGKYPSNRVIEISYSEDFALLFGRRNKAKVEEFGSKIFNLQLAKNPNSNTEFELDKTGGGMISRGVMSGVTGRPCNLMIIDDPIKNRQEADSETYRERLWSEWNDSFKTRLAAGAKVIVIQTRWHEDDLIGRIKLNERHVEEINLPCEAEENDPLGRDVGKALFPEIGKDDNWLEEYKRGYMTTEGIRSWTALFQGHPTTKEGTMFKRDWFKYYDKDKVQRLIPMKVLSVDATFKDSETSDFVAIQVWGKMNSNYYLIDRIKKRMDFPETITAIQKMLKKHKDIRFKLIEDKANGSAIISFLRKAVDGILPVNPQGGKVARANAVAYLIESGNVYLPEDEAWTEEFIDECCKFPNAAHDDEVDAMTQALSKMKTFEVECAKVLTPQEEEYEQDIDKDIRGNYLEWGGS